MKGLPAGHDGLYIDHDRYLIRAGRKETVMNQSHNRIINMSGKLLSLALAAAVITGCAGAGTVTDGPQNEEEIVTVYVTDAGPAADSANSTGSGTDAGGDFLQAAADTPSDKQNPTASFPLLSDGSGTAGTQPHTPSLSTNAVGSDPDKSPLDELSGISPTAEGPQIPADTDRDSRISERKDPDTALKESVLFDALVDCTGWGQSTGSSLHAATAATGLLCWANEAETAVADPDILEAAAGDEISRLTPDEQAALKDNWSTISYNASMILDDFDEILPLLEDAGCGELAREASENANALKNWRAAEKALEPVVDRIAPAKNHTEEKQSDRASGDHTGAAATDSAAAEQTQTGQEGETSAPARDGE